MKVTKNWCWSAALRSATFLTWLLQRIAHLHLLKVYWTMFQINWCLKEFTRLICITCLTIHQPRNILPKLEKPPVMKWAKLSCSTLPASLCPEIGSNISNPLTRNNATRSGARCAALLKRMPLWRSTSLKTNPNWKKTHRRFWAWWPRTPKKQHFWRLPCANNSKSAFKQLLRMAGCN